MNNFWKIAAAVIGDDNPIGTIEQIIDVMTACNVADEENEYMLKEIISYCEKKMEE